MARSPAERKKMMQSATIELDAIARGHDQLERDVFSVTQLSLR
jgi:hypothetical protein